YDSNERLIEKVLPDNTHVHFAYTPAGLRIQAGAATFAYDARDQLIEETKADGESLFYTYDTVGNRISVTTPEGVTTYTYDALNRLETVTAPDGGVTTYTYDAVGNRASVMYPNGITTLLTYDARNLLTQVVHNDANGHVIASYIYTLGLAGNRLR